MFRLAIAALLLTVSVCDAFVVPTRSVSFVSRSLESVRLHAAEEPESDTKEPLFAETSEEEVAEEVADEKEEEVVDVEEEKVAEEEEEETEPETEVTFLKQEIADLETILKAKQLLLEYHQEKVGHYSKDGYARMVAEMETMRRMRAVRFVCSCCCF